MKKVQFLLMAFLATPLLNSAQQLAGLVREEITSVQDYTASPDSWIPESRTIYQYNTKGQKSHAILMAWDPSADTWKIRSESEYSYDRMGRQVRSFSKEYDQYPDIVSGEIENRTYFAPWTSPNFFEQTGSYYRRVDYENEIEEIREQKCDKDTLEDFSSCLYYEYFRDKTSVREETKNVTNESDKGLKASWTVNRTTLKENKQTRIFADSTVNFYQEEIAGIPIQTDYYHSEYSEPYRLIRQEKREYEFNDEELLVADRTWKRIPGETWSLLYESLNSYDSLGNLAESVFKDYRDPFPHFSRRIVYSKEMTEQGEIDFNTRYNWDFSLDRWIPSDKYGSIGLDQERYFIVWSNWDTVSNEFTYRFEEWWSWYENDEEGKNIIRNKGLDLASGTQFDYTREQGWKKRCDGEIIEGYDLLVEGTPAYEFQNHRTMFSYFDLAECETGQPAATITVFPNPCHDILNIYSEERLGKSFLSITDEAGRIVFFGERELTNFTLIDLESFRPGLYYLQLSNGTLEYSGKFILTR